MMKLTEKIKQIQDGLIQGVYNGNPHLASDDKSYLAGCISYYTELLQQMVRIRSTEIQEIRQREDVKSDASAIREWNATENGLKYTEYEHWCKRIKNLMGGLKTIIESSRDDSMGI